MLKKIILFIFLFLSIQFNAQDIDYCSKIVDKTVEAINSKSTSNLKPHLAPDFSIAEQEGNIAIMVLDQLITQLNETVLNNSKSNSRELPDGLELKYNINYKNMGEREATFVFDKSNRLRELNLFEMQVKTMSNENNFIFPDNEIIEIPFKQVGNLISVEVSINNQNKTFLVDSGAPRVIINSKYYKSSYGNRSIASPSQGVNGAITNLDIVKIDEINFNGIKLKNQDVLASDISHLEEDLNVEIHGLIGYDILSNYDILFNYESKTLTLIKPTSFLKFKNNYFKNYSEEKVAIKLSQHIPIISVIIGKNQYDFGVDSGAETNLIDEKYYKKVKKYLSNESSDSLIGAENKEKIVKTASLTELVIGGSISFNNTNTVFSDISHLNQAYQLSIAGILGYEILSKYPTLLSYSRKEIIFFKE